MKSLRALGLYAVLTVALTWPYAANLWVMEVGDPAFFAWEVGWTVHALEQILPSYRTRTSSIPCDTPWGSTSRCSGRLFWRCRWRSSPTTRSSSSTS